MTTARELQHRVKNSLAIVQSIASQSFRSTRTKEDGLRTFTGRMKALAAATDLLTKDNWTIVSVRELIEEIVSPYREDGHDRFHLSGENLHIDSAHSVNLGMALHELCTNAVKYGALSRDGGEVFIRWAPTAEGISLEWRERGGPPVTPPSKTGFGTKLLRSGLFKEASGSVDLAFEPEGLVAHIDVRRQAPRRTSPQT
jgi:two-component sensor histidine kinase